ncbi:hypothetical protein WALSEDRAFT_37505 [Wallemia mellicola CBS 633.66]|uniref:Signal recognition particle subunit SRP72 n=1 Tax=Wallemia mellicola (strain ATCC MYA-4683 / CBS 633.66) TaxID=671144 RepID=I4YDI7_WALMC|nr:hypothetical protein WALSEDRAFT_37505 [Wallemia mellicola CBS 633.66]EIM22029.1 hypothetical protein WALSEDRAFT_37505 [Wallemia mellicola CBS 633.66]|eukprot:XP_006957836.1 hypothetical protein WALSEDRAFT_37505 [Wallemia mellicola CBS 633.66]
MITKTVNYKKLPPKEEKSKEVRIPKLYKRLYSQITNGYYKNALQTTSKLLNLEGNNDELIKTKLFLLLQLDSYNQALSLTENSSFDFEEAYTNYRLKKNTSTSSGNDRKWSILQAQLAYRQADYQSAINLYQSLLSDLDPNDDEYHDIETNLKAAKESLDFHSHGYLTAIEELNVPPLDVLESNPAPFPENYNPQNTTVDLKSTTLVDNKSQKIEKQKQKRRQEMHSKYANKNIPIDSERWIPYKERSYYKKPRQQMSINHKRR